MGKLLIAISLSCALSLAASPARSMAPPPSMAFNVAPRPALSGLTVSGEGLGLHLTARHVSRDRLRSGSAAVGNPQNERLSSWRLDAQLDYELLPRLTAILGVPYSFNRFQFNGADQRYDALGDVTLLGRYAVYRDRPRAPRSELGLLAGVKLPIGSTTVSAHGTPLSATQQPGSGTTDFVLGVAGFSPWGEELLYGDLSRKFNTHAAYTFGDQLAANLGVYYPLGAAGVLGLTGELNLEASDPDRSIDAGTGVRPDGRVENTGGWTAYASPGLQWRVHDRMSLTLAVQLPVYRYVNGTQLAAQPTWVVGLHTRLGS
jgi:hypothetical protein